MKILEQLAKVQQELKAPKDLRNNFGNYNYRSCESILEAVKPLLSKHGLALTLTDEIVQVGERIYVKAIATAYLNNGAGTIADAISVSAFAREEESKKGMDASQVTGAASSYARKYALNGLFCIDDNKDSDATNTHGKEKPPESAGVVCESCGKKIMPYNDTSGKPVSLRAHVERSRSRFGKVLCLDCIANEIPSVNES